MKRYIQPLKTWIEIVVYVDPSLPQDIAAVNLNHPHSKFKLTDSELRVYADFVESMISPIQAHEFKITESYQSKKSYAYYVKFYPVDKEGEILDADRQLDEMNAEIDEEQQARMATAMQMQNSLNQE